MRSASVHVAIEKSQSMTEDWKVEFKKLGFKASTGGGMVSRFEDVEITVVEHPFQGLSIGVLQFDGRHGTEFETFLPRNAKTVEISRAMLEIYWSVHPEKRPKNNGAKVFLVRSDAYPQLVNSGDNLSSNFIEPYFNRGLDHLLFR